MQVNRISNYISLESAIEIKESNLEHPQVYWLHYFVQVMKYFSIKIVFYSKTLVPIRIKNLGNISFEMEEIGHR